MNEINNESELKEHTQALLSLICPPVTFTGLRRLFLMLTQSHFAFPENHGPLFESTLACRVYDLSGKKREGQLDISLRNTKKGNNDSVPSIQVSIAGGAFEKGGMGADYAGKSDDNSTRFQTKIAQTQLKFKFRDTDGDLALTMAESIMGFLESLKLPLMEDMGLHSLDVVKLTDIEDEEPEPENVDSVTLLVNIQFDFSIALVTESHRLKKMALSLQPTI